MPVSIKQALREAQPVVTADIRRFYCEFSHGTLKPFIWWNTLCLDRADQVDQFLAAQVWARLASFTDILSWQPH